MSQALVLTTVNVRLSAGVRIIPKLTVICFLALVTFAVGLILEFFLLR